MVTNGNIISVTFVIKYFAMKERLIQLLDLEQLSPSKFADIIGVQRSSISHIISGRNKPSFDFLQKTLRAFPGLNASWLLMGEGTMYEQMGRNISGNLFDAPEASEVPAEENISAKQVPTAQADTPEGPDWKDPEVRKEEEPADNETTMKVEQTSESQKPDLPVQKKVVQVMLIYEDDTFRSLIPEN